MDIEDKEAKEEREVTEEKVAIGGPEEKIDSMMRTMTEDLKEKIIDPNSSRS